MQLSPQGPQHLLKHFEISSALSSCYLMKGEGLLFIYPFGQEHQKAGASQRSYSEKWLVGTGHAKGIIARTASPYSKLPHTQEHKVTADQKTLHRLPTPLFLLVHTLDSDASIAWKRKSLCRTRCSSIVTGLLILGLWGHSGPWFVPLMALHAQIRKLAGVELP